MYKVYYLILLMIIILICSLWKYEKTLITIVSIEMCSLLLLSTIVLSVGVYYYIIVIFTFFISEALVLMSAIYLMLRLYGLYTSNVLMQ